MSYQEIHLASRPVTDPSVDNFALAQSNLPELQDGEVLVENAYMSVDPYMRGRMRDVKSYVPPFQIGEVLQGGAVGYVKASNSPKFKAGDAVSSFNGWRQAFVAKPEELTPLDLSSGVPIQAFLGTLGMPGLTAYVGMKLIGEPKAGETVLVSAAAGAVGTVVCQYAKIHGCRVIGTAGSDEKCDWLVNELGIDAAVNYKTAGNLEKAIAAHAPKGVDVYFENVGGDHLQAAINLLNPFGRVPTCGMISQYNKDSFDAGPNNLINIVGKSLKIQGFIVGNYTQELPNFIKDMSQWISEGKLKWEETVYEGIDKAPQAFIDLFSGQNSGKMLVKVS